MVAAPASAAAATFATLLLLHLFLHFCARKSKKGQLRPEEAELVKEIKELHRTANALSSPEAFAKAAKLKRAAVAKEKELAQLRQKLALHTGSWVSFYFLAPYALKAGVYIIFTGWFWNTPVAIIPLSLVHPFEHLVGTGYTDLSRELVLVGIIPWLVLSSRVSNFISQRLVGKQS